MQREKAREVPPLSHRWSQPGKAKHRAVRWRNPVKPTMFKRFLVLGTLLFAVGTLASAQGPRKVALGDWPEARGPHGDGRSDERAWSTSGPSTARTSCGASPTAGDRRRS